MPRPRVSWLPPSALSISGPSVPDDRDEAAPRARSLTARTPARVSPPGAQRRDDELEHRPWLEIRRSRLEELALGFTQAVDQRSAAVFADDAEALVVTECTQCTRLVLGVRRVRSRIQDDDTRLPAQDVEHAGPVLVARPKVVETIAVVPSAGLVDVEHRAHPVRMEGAAEGVHALAVFRRRDSDHEHGGGNTPGRGEKQDPLDGVDATPSSAATFPSTAVLLRVAGRVHWSCPTHRSSYSTRCA